MNTPPNRYEVILEREAKKDYDRLRGNDLKRITQALEELEVNPRPGGCTKLRGHQNRYRVREGTLRIVYAIEDDQLIVLVLRIKPRKDAYRDL